MHKTHPLDADLDRYSATARTVLNLKKPAKRLGELALYTAAAGAALALAPGAEASIIYSGGTQDITVHRTRQNTTNTANTHVDLNKDGQADLFFGIYSFANGTSQLDRAHVNGAVIGSMQAVRLFNTGSFDDLLKLASSTRDVNYPIGANTAVGNLGILRAHTAYSTGSYAGGLWNPGANGSTSGFAGIILNTSAANGVQSHFGWLHFKLATDANNRTDSLTLIDWAFQSVAGEGIHVGDKGVSVPEPSGLALMALGALGIAGLRRRRRGEKANRAEATS